MTCSQDHHTRSEEEEVYHWDTFLKFFLHLNNMVCILAVWLLCGMDCLLLYVPKTLKKNPWNYAYDVFRILLIVTKIFNNCKRIIGKRCNNE